MKQMGSTSRALYQRYSGFFSTHVDAVFMIAEHFSHEFAESEKWTSDVFRGMWGRFAALEPADREAALYDALYRRIHAGSLGLPPLRTVSHAPLEGEWSPVRPSDSYVATTLLWGAESVNPQIDWPVLHLLVRTGLTTDMWSQITQRTLQATTRTLRSYQHGAHSALMIAALEMAGPRCVKRPRLEEGAAPFDIEGHIFTCVDCNGFTELLVPVQRLIIGAAHTKLQPADKQRMFSSALKGISAPTAHRSRWWTMQG